VGETRKTYGDIGGENRKLSDGLEDTAVYGIILKRLLKGYDGGVMCTGLDETGTVL
jgi:hypothetical protein